MWQTMSKSDVSWYISLGSTKHPHFAESHTNQLARWRFLFCVLDFWGYAGFLCVCKLSLRRRTIYGFVRFHEHKLIQIAFNKSHISSSLWQQIMRLPRKGDSFFERHFRRKRSIFQHIRGRFTAIF